MIKYVINKLYVYSINDRFNYDNWMDGKVYVIKKVIFWKILFNKDLFLLNKGISMLLDKDSIDKLDKFIEICIHNTDFNYSVKEISREVNKKMMSFFSLRGIHDNGQSNIILGSWYIKTRDKIVSENSDIDLEPGVRYYVVSNQGTTYEKI